MALDQVKLSISAGEVLRPGTTIELNAPRPIDARSAQGAVCVGHRNEPARRAMVEVRKRGRLLAVPTDGLPPGPHELTIDELLDTKGGRLVERLVVPFQVVPLSGRVPPELRVEHAVRLVVGDLGIERLAPGATGAKAHVDVVKAVRRENGEPVDLAFDEKGRQVDFAKLQAAVARRRFEKYGRIDETLARRLEKAGRDERIDIVVWPRLEVSPAPYEKPTEGRVMEAPEGERQVADTVRRAVGELRDRVQRAGMKAPSVEEQGEHPFLRTRATAAQIRALADDEAVGAIFFDDRTVITDLGDSIAVAHSDSVQTAGFDGTDIRVAVWEDGPSDATNLSFAGRFSTSPPASHHARLTSAIIKNTEANHPHGHAPDCDLYSANSGDADALRWAIRD